MQRLLKLPVYQKELEFFLTAQMRFFAASNVDKTANLFVLFLLLNIGRMEDVEAAHVT